MIHPRTENDPMRRSQLLSRILDPEYSGVAPPSSHSSSFRPRSPSLPQASVFVDRWGQQHDPDFRPFGSYPVITPDERDREHESWPWDDDEPALSSPRRSSGAVSRSSSSYHSSSSGSRSRSTSVILTPPLVETDKGQTSPRARISPPGHIPRSALFPWTPAQRAARVQHETPKRHIPLPPPLQEEDAEIPLALVDSRYVPGYGHVLPQVQRSRTVATPAETAEPATPKQRNRSHTVPLPARTHKHAESTAENGADAEIAQSPSCTHSLRQSVYSLGLKTKLGLYHMKVRVRKASSAAKRPLSL